MSLLGIGACITEVAHDPTPQGREPEHVDAFLAQYWTDVFAYSHAVAPTPVAIQDQGSVLVPAQPIPGVGAGDRGEISALVCSGAYLWDCGWALGVIDCESRGDQNAVGEEWIDTNHDGVLEHWYFVGWFQIATIDPALIPTLADPARNIAEADYKYRNGGPGHWPVCQYR